MGRSLGRLFCKLIHPCLLYIEAVFILLIFSPLTHNIYQIRVLNYPPNDDPFLGQIRTALECNEELTPYLSLLVLSHSQQIRLPELQLVLVSQKRTRLVH